MSRKVFQAFKSDRNRPQVPGERPINVVSDDDVFSCGISPPKSLQVGVVEFVSRPLALHGHRLRTERRENKVHLVPTLIAPQ